MPESTDKSYKFGPFRMDLSNERLFRHSDNERVRLSETEFTILRLFVEHPKQLFTTEELLDKFFGEVEDNNLTQKISALRKTLGELPGENRYIQTIPNEGYRFVADVHEIKGHNESEALNQVTPVQKVVTTAEKETENEPASAGDLIVGTPPSPDFIPGEQGLQGGHINQRSARDDSDGASNDRNETFERWFSRMPGSLIAMILLVCIVMTYVLSIAVAYNGGPYSNAQAMKIASGAQCLVILLMFLLSLFWIKAEGFRPTECNEADIVKAGFRNQAEFEKNRGSLEDNLKRYSWWWRGLLLSWVPLYFVFARGEFPGYQIYLVVFNLINTFMLGACFYTLNKNEDDQDPEHMAGGVLNVVVLVILAGVLLTFLLRSNLDGATLLTGILAGITTALVVGRLQSRFIRPRFWILYLLYSYTAIQPLVLYIEGHPGWGWMILDFALLLKCLLYVYMAWLFQSGLLLFYFASVNRTDNTLREQRKAFQKLIGTPDQ